MRDDAPSRTGGGRRFDRYSTKSLVIGIFVLVAGICVLMYPYASNYLAELQQMRIMNEHYEIVQETDTALLDGLYEDAVAYNDAIAHGGQTDILADGSQSYEHLLDLAGNGCMGMIFIPSIDIEKPIYHGVDDEVLAKGIGHLPKTSLPVGGPSTHAVLTGHTGLPSGRFFDAIDQLKPGDWFVVECLGRDCAYRVAGIETVLPEEVGTLVVEEGADQVTLVTCTPYGVNTHRLLVHGERIPLPAEWVSMKDAGEVAAAVDFIAPKPLWPWTVAGCGIAFAIVLGFVAARRTKREKRGQGR